MRTEPVTLRHVGSRPAGLVTLSDPTGRDELGVDGVDTRSAVALLDRLLGGRAPLEAGVLTAADRDALLAALHRHCWSDRIVSTLTCVSCGEPFDLSFELSAVQRHLSGAATDWRAHAGVITHPDGRSIPLPTAHDELESVSEGAPGAAERLAARVGISADALVEAAEALEAAAPILDLDLGAECADCGRHQLAHFDLQSYVLQRLLDERETLLADIHALAARYGWSLGEILDLPRQTRQSFAKMASGASPAGPRTRHGGGA